MTDVEGSTALWERDPEGMGEAVAVHDQIVGARVLACDGIHIKARGEGDSHFAVFESAVDAVRCAGELQAALGGRLGPGGEPLRVRIAIHSGDAQLRDGDYYGQSVNRCARLRAVGHGGQVLLSSVTAALLPDPLPGGLSLHDLGTHRLKDLAVPERISQLRGPGLAPDFPPLRTLDAHAHNLPVQLTTFVGRDDELIEVRELLSTSRLLCLIGTGGAGKTRLALQVAAECIDGFDDGVWLVDLASVTMAAPVASIVAQSLGLRESPGRTHLDVLTQHLRERSLLLVFDNCEHLVSQCAELAEQVLARCPTVAILATSREALGVPGEVTWTVPPLGAPETVATTTAGEIEKYPSVQLFVQRASAARPGFRVTDANAHLVAQICARLDGIPLAIELAAARVRALSVEQVAERLDDRFRLLTGGSRTALPRQQTLRALVDWSFELLTDEERTVLGRLSVFRGGATLEAVESVCAGDGIDAIDVLDLIVRLVDKSMAVADSGDGDARYRLLETIRRYALEKLSEDEAEAIAIGDRHFDWFLTFAEQVTAGAWYRDDEAPAPRLRDLVVEHDNLRAALEWGSTHPARRDEWLRLVASLGPFWLGFHHWTEGRQWIEEALPERERLDAEARLRLLGAHQDLCWQQFRNANFRPYWTEVVELAETVGNTRRLAMVLYRLGGMAWRLADYQAALAAFTRGLALFRGLGDLSMQGLVLQSLGLIEDSRGRPDQATSFYQEALSIQRSANTNSDPWILTTIGRHAMDRGDLEEARRHFEEYAEHAVRSGDRGRRSRAAQSLGALALKEGKPDEALRHFEERLVLAAQLEDRGLEAWAEAHLSTALFALGDRDGARRHLDEALGIFRALGAEKVRVAVLRRVAETAFDRADYKLADELLEEAARLAVDGDEPGELAWVESDWGRVAAAAGDSKAAFDHHCCAIELFRAANGEWGVLRSLRLAAEAAATIGDDTTAAILTAEADGLAHQLDSATG